MQNLWRRRALLRRHEVADLDHPFRQIKLTLMDVVKWRCRHQLNEKSGGLVSTSSFSRYHRVEIILQDLVRDVPVQKICRDAARNLPLALQLELQRAAVVAINRAGA